VLFFANDSNNSAIGGAYPNGTGASFSGTYVSGTDETHLAVGQSIPVVTSNHSFFLMYVMNN
jgi:hypothetical protein